MRALSLWQPWATLVVAGEKRVETRSWTTRYRGPLAIVATKRMPAHAVELCRQYPFGRALEAAGYPPPRNNGREAPWDARLPRGCVVGVVDLVNVVPTATLLAEADEDRRFLRQSMLDRGWSVGEHEAEFGDYSPGRYAWRLENPRRLSWTIDSVGRQGLWTLAASVAARIEAQLYGEE